MLGAPTSDTQTSTGIRLNSEKGLKVWALFSSLADSHRSVKSIWRPHEKGFSHEVTNTSSFGWWSNMGRIWGAHEISTDFDKFSRWNFAKFPRNVLITTEWGLFWAPSKMFVCVDTLHKHCSAESTLRSYFLCFRRGSLLEALARSVRK